VLRCEPPVIRLDTVWYSQIPVDRLDLPSRTVPVRTLSSK
jgi:hypothetical protein